MIWFIVSNFAQAWAAGGAHGDAHAIPWTTIIAQSFNFLFLIGVLVYLLRKTVKAHFANRAKEYHELVNRAETARKQAEDGKRVIQDRLAALEASSQDGLAQARREAEELRARMIEDAKNLADRLQSEAERTAQIELEKAKAELRAELLRQALNVSRDSLQTKLESSDQKQLQKEFADKIQVVGS